MLILNSDGTGASCSRLLSPCQSYWTHAYDRSGMCSILQIAIISILIIIDQPLILMTFRARKMTR